MAKAGNNVRHGPRPISNISQKIQHQKQRFLWLRKAGKPLTLCYKLPVYNVIPPNKTVSRPRTTLVEKSHGQQQFLGENKKTHALHRGKRTTIISK
ncbi:hypothetical protein AVEN_164608-1 [Araneus ventricosus]|uniref:Uncharacterized protein n=1 Tax=Araneus ventricosus TaxID=182803 RepID=A0A4Y2B571_ARAVE|nr:hypothetical protein AVEN_164608-1 [Araneus ventricosus]